MKKIIIVPIFLIVTLSVFSQNSSEIASLIKAAQDSMQNKKYKVAWRILDGCAAISDDTATIASLQSTLYKKAIDDGFEAYRQRQFDMAVMYYSDVAVDDTALVCGPYWVSNAKRMKLLNKVNGVVHMSALTTMLASAVNDTYLTSVDEYESLFKNTVNILCENMNKKGRKENAPFLHAVQDAVTMKWGYADQEQTILIPCEFDRIVSDFNYGLAVVVKDGIYGFLHESGLSTYNMSDKSTYQAGVEPIKGLIKDDMKITINNTTFEDFYKELQRKISY